MDFSSKQGLYFDARMLLIQEQLAAGEKICNLRFRGVSMLPMLRQEKDSVELSPLPEELKKYDLPVYRRADGQYVMHRIVAVKDDCYICLGDNTIALERILPEQMIGVVSAFYRGNRRIEVDAPGYQVNCRLWRLTWPCRSLWNKARVMKQRITKLLRKRI